MSENGVAMPSDHDLCGAIRELLAKKLLIQLDSPDADLLAAGILDSLALVQLLLHLEERFAVKIPLETLEIDDLRSLTSIARLVENQLRAQTQVAVNR
jgi:D-alanine--poly(phosphoribitol) ligase subunit 2